MNSFGFLRARALAQELHDMMIAPTGERSAARAQELCDAILVATQRAYPVDEQVDRLRRSMDGTYRDLSGERVPPSAMTGMLVLAVEAARQAAETGEPVPRPGEMLFPSTITAEEAAADPDVTSIEELRARRDKRSAVPAHIARIASVIAGAYPAAANVPLEWLSVGSVLALRVRHASDEPLLVLFGDEAEWELLPTETVKTALLLESPKRSASLCLRIVDGALTRDEAVAEFLAVRFPEQWLPVQP